MWGRCLIWAIVLVSYAVPVVSWLVLFVPFFCFLTTGGRTTNNRIIIQCQSRKQEYMAHQYGIRTTIFRETLGNKKQIYKTTN
ncbi:TPA: hypothetical protein DHW51_11230 [Candidatus Poribacteria bacterium]|nr:hypothetical protein [Candidatus Poribacteria bacterium]